MLDELEGLGFEILLEGKDSSVRWYRARATVDLTRHRGHMLTSCLVSEIRTIG